MNVQVIADAFGRLLWASPALPGAVHDIKAARTHGIIEALTEAGVRTWADKGYQRARGTIRVPYFAPRTVSLSAVRLGASTRTAPPANDSKGARSPWQTSE